MSQGQRLFGTNGIRGTVNQDLTPEFVAKIGCAIGTFYKAGKLIVGYDGRTSNVMFAAAMMSGLTATGCTVYDVGVAPTPTVQFSVKRHKMDGGVILTASHNPPQYNGIKVTASDGVEIPREDEEEIENIYHTQKFALKTYDKIGQTHILPGIIDEYIEAIKTHVNVAAIQKKHYHVIADPGNGTGGLVAPYLLRDLGCRITALNANLDGTFPNRPSEPRPETLNDLMRVVKTLGADFGVAYDGDADRAIFIDETGMFHPGDQTFALVEKFFLKEHSNEIIVTPVSSSFVVKEIADAYRAKVEWTKVGSTTVSMVMKKLKTKLGGEENGGVFYGPHQPVRDGAMTTALVLDIMAKTGKTLSRLLGELPQYFIEKDKIECPNSLKERVLTAFADSVKNLNVDATDGVKLLFDDKSSILIRPSGTEPIYRFYAEGKTKQRAVQLIKKYKTQLNALIEKMEA